MSATESLVARRGAVLAALVALAAGLPSLSLPFLSDDWGHLVAVSGGQLLRTPFGYFRPLCAASYWIDWSIWGLRPLPYHLLNVVLAPVAACLVVILARRYTGDAVLAGCAGLLFALHPYHVENVAWVAGRADLLVACLLMGAALAYDRWRDKPSGWPLAALILHEAALLSKENAVVLPPFLLLLGLVDRRRRPTRIEWLRGLVPVLGLTLVHFLLVRPLALGDLSVSQLQYLGDWPRRLYFFGVSALVPLQTEWLEADPLLWGGLAAGIGVLLLLGARLGAGRLPALIWPAAAGFVTLLGPSLISFQERFAFLPGAAAAVAIAALLRAAPRKLGLALASLVVVGWTLSALDHWADWRSAGRASEQVVLGLVEVAARPDVEEIVVAGMPHRVAGAPVRTTFDEVLSLHGYPGVRATSAVELDYPSATGDALVPPREQAIQRLAGYGEVRFAVPRRRYSRYTWPPIPPGTNLLGQAWGEIEILRTDPATGSPLELRVRVRAAPGRSALVWANGKLEPLGP